MSNSSGEGARARRVYRMNVVTATLIRSAGFALTIVALALHNLFVLGSVDPRPVAAIAIALAVHCGLGFVVLHFAYRKQRSEHALDLSGIFQLGDILLIASAVYVSGGERSWMHILIAVPVVNQTHISALQALVFGHVGTVAYAAALLSSGITDMRAAATKVFILHVAVLLCTAVAVVAERHRRRVGKALRRARQLAERLQAAGRAAGESLELREVLARVLEQLRHVIEYDSASIQLIEGDAMRVIAVAGRLPESEIGRLRPLGTTGYNRRLAASREPVILELPAPPDVWEEVEGLEYIRTVMGVPLIARDRIVGAMSIDTSTPHAYGPDDGRVALAFAGQVAMCIENARLYEAMVDLSWHDPLTGVANRRRFDEILAVEWRRAARTSSSLAALMIDIDHFKLFNDRYGHQAGDEVLRSVAAALSRSAARAGDLLARYGGEEFVALLPSMTLPEALVHAETLCGRVRELAILHADAPDGLVTVSIGVAVTQPAPGSSPAALVAMADQALYEAKRAGRNRAA